MTDTKQSTEENDVIKQFMELINQQNMGEQSQDFMELFRFAAGMQLQLAVMRTSYRVSDSSLNSCRKTSRSRLKSSDFRKSRGKEDKLQEF